MTDLNVKLFNDYNRKAVDAARAFGELNLSTVELFFNKQVELNSNLLETALASSQEISKAKTPVDALQVSGQLVQELVETVSGFVKETTADAVKARDELKVAFEEAVKLNEEYAAKAVENGVVNAKKAARKAA